MRNLFFILPVIISIGMISCSAGNNSSGYEANTALTSDLKLSSSNANSPLQTELEQLSETFLNAYSETTHVSALPILAQCGGQAPVYIYNGTISYDSARKITVSSIFQIGSITKSFTSVVLLQLAAESMYNYNLDQPIGQWISNLPLSWQKITSRELMHMVSGIPSYTKDNSFMQTYVYDMPYAYHDLEFFAYSQANKPLLFAPGTNYDYSNTNYTLLGMLIEKITGRSVYKEIEDRVIHRLGLQQTYFPSYLPELVIDPQNLVSGYATLGFGESFDDVKTWTLSPMNASGGIISNINDINTYVYNLYNPGKLLTSAQIDELTSLVSENDGRPIATVSESDPVGYGLGIFSIYDSPGQPFYSYMDSYVGATLGFSFSYYYNPKNKNMVVYAVNANVDFDESYFVAYNKIGIDIMAYLESNCN